MRTSSGGSELDAVSKTNFLNNYLARVLFTPNQERTMEMKDKVLSSLGAQDMDTSWYQSSDINKMELYRENDQLDVVAVLKSCIYTLFSPGAFENLEMGGSGENPILLDEEQDNESSPPTSSLSERPTQLPALLSSIRNKNKKNPDELYGNWFQYVLLCMCLDSYYN